MNALSNTRTRVSIAQSEIMSERSDGTSTKSLRARASFQRYCSSHVSLMSLAKDLNNSFNQQRR